MKYLCFDIGGTALKYGIFNEDAQLIQEFEPLETGVLAQDKALEESVLKTVESVMQDHEIKGVGISTAGVVNNKTGQVIYAGGTIPHYGNPAFKTLIEERFNVPCVVENDVNAAALGEMWKGSLKGIDNAAMLTVGTGIGGAVILNGSLHRGHNFSAGEIGYMKIANDDYQKLAATSILTDKVSTVKNKTLNGIEVFELIRNNDEETLAIFEELIENLAKGLLNIMYLLNPERIVLGGGVMSQFDIIEPVLKKYIEKHQEAPHFTQTEILPASLKNDAGMIGVLSKLVK